MPQNLPSQVLRSLIALTEKRESIASQLEKLDAQITATLSGQASKAVAAVTGKPAVKAKGTRKRGKRGALKGLILSALETAGSAGVAVRDLAAQLGVKPQNVHVWFATTGKKHADKTGKGLYRLKGAKPAPAPAAPASETKPAPKTKAPAKKTKPAKAVKKVKTAAAKAAPAVAPKAVAKPKAKAKRKPAKKAVKASK